ncbi:MAG: hydantoinase/oxoprolinase family protein [Chloroflexi bacterium]|nr:hydantoinase/oxoprolinase family protein [Chloroflexota bacterium]
MKVRIGVDAGGTFTDVALFEEASGKIGVTKVSSTPDDPSRAILKGVDNILSQEGHAPADVSYLAHGTTVATNTLIQHGGARTGLITTRGFRDLLELGRQRRPDLYDLQVDKPEALVTRDLRLEVDERARYDGRVERPLDPEDVVRAVRALKDRGAKAVAVCFLYSYLNPGHEQLVKEIVRREMPEAYVSTSHEVSPEFREYERLSTVVINAYLGPAVAKYVHNLEVQLGQLGVPVGAYITQSNGGIISMQTARENPVRTVLSGPSAGVVGGSYVGTLAGFGNVITFDMGGTSTDVSLVENGLQKVTGEMEVQGYPIRVPMIEVNTVGAGGGSIAWIDSGGHMKVGPRSAGAVPGPACYGLGNDEPTVTDANVVLQTLNPEYLLGGRMPIDARASADVIQRMARRLGMTPLDVAQGIISVVTANMARAIRVISVRKGYDPRDFALLAFGGAGPLHAVQLARELSIPRVLVPEVPGILCALGLLVTDIRSDYTLTRIMAVEDRTAEEVNGIFRDLEARAAEWLDHEQVAEPDRIYRRSVDMRYRGQNYELTVPVRGGTLAPEDMAGLVEAFHQAHKQNYGYFAEGEPTQLVTFRLEALGRVPKATLTSYPGDGTDSRHAIAGRRRVYFEEARDFVDCPVYQREPLRAGNVIEGPAVVEQLDATSVVFPGQRAYVDAYRNIVIEVGDGTGRG